MTFELLSLRTNSGTTTRAASDRPRGSAGAASGDGGLEDALRLGDAVALRVIDAEAGEHLDDLGVLGKLGDRLLAGQVPDLVDRAHHLAVDRIAQDLAH